jgi:hypothetical protein
VSDRPPERLRRTAAKSAASVFLCGLVTCVFVVSTAVSAVGDTLLCADDDDDGIVEVFKSVGLPDRDCDTELSVADGGNDCNDLHSQIRNGTFSSDGCSAGEYHYCENGVYKTGPGGSLGCTSAAPTERATNYYVNTDSGNDSNDCSNASPCATFTKFSAGGSITVGGDTAIYLRGSAPLTDTNTGNRVPLVTFRTQSAGTSAELQNIIAHDPRGPRTTIAPTGCSTSVSDCVKFEIEDDNWWVRGFEITGGHDDGIKLVGADNLRASDNWVHDIDGRNNDNLTGIDVSGSIPGDTNIRVDHNIINDVWDADVNSGSNPTSAAQFDSTTMIRTWKANNSIIEANYISNTLDPGPNGSFVKVAARGISGKHSCSAANCPDGIIYRYNIVTKIQGQGIQGLNVHKTKVYGNLVLTHTGFAATENGGGDGYTIDGLDIHHNTSVVYDYNSTQAAIGINDTTSTGAYQASPTLGVYVRDNIVVDNQTTYDAATGNEAKLITIGANGEDGHYEELFVTNHGENFPSGYFVSDGNCFYNPNIAGLTNGFCLYCETPLSLGGGGNFATFWKTTMGMDALGFNEDPFSGAAPSASDYRATSANCLGKGWEYYWPVAVPRNLPVIFLQGS